MIGIYLFLCVLCVLCGGVLSLRAADFCASFLSWQLHHGSLWVSLQKIFLKGFLMSQRPYTRRKAKGLFAEIQQLVLHPVAFFEALPEQGDSRTWLMVAFLILVLIGYSAIQQAALLPEDFSQTTGNPVQQQVVTGLMAASRLIIAWLAQAILLLPIALFSKKSPRFALNLHIAIWSSLPFAILAIIQLAYLWAGGPIGGSGIAPALSSVLPYDMLTSNLGILLINFAEHFTLFGIWNLILLYLGGRYSLQGNGVLVFGLLLLWLIVLLLVPTMIDIASTPAPSF